jgi:metal-sulfur cluster biosynthetic enzyme
MSTRISIQTEDDIATDTGTLPANTPLRERAIHALRNVYDPELPINIYDLGLIYNLDLNEADQTAHITMTLTAPNCPVAEELPKQAQQAVSQATNFTTTLTLTFTPPWNKDNLPLEAKLALGLL